MAFNDFVSKVWSSSVVPTLEQFVRIENQSPMFDESFRTNGLQEQAVELLRHWAEQQQVRGMSLEVVKLGERTPLIFAEIAATSAECKETVILYGHYDKQPPLTEAWEQGLHPYKPVTRDGKMYGRGVADDGYAIFTAITAIKAMQVQNIPHARYVLVIEGCEESGSPDLPHYIDHLSSRIGTPSLVVCLDSGCGNYEQMWLTTSLRGMMAGNFRVQLLNEGVHSGRGSGIIADSFRVSRQLLDRLENVQTGEILLPELYTKIPAKRVTEAGEMADAAGDNIFLEFPTLPNVQPITRDGKELALNRTWRPTLTVTGAGGLPALQQAGNVLRTHTTLKLSLRLPPGVSAQNAVQAVRETLTRDPPYGASVEFDCNKAADGWEAPELAPWLEESLNEASHAYYGPTKGCRFLGEGGSIPFMGMLHAKFPDAQFVITGVLGPQSNAHGPNEFLHIDYSCKLTSCIAHVLQKHTEHYSGASTSTPAAKKARTQ